MKFLLRKYNKKEGESCIDITDTVMDGSVFDVDASNFKCSDCGSKSDLVVIIDVSMRRFSTDKIDGSFLSVPSIEVFCGNRAAHGDYWNTLYASDMYTTEVVCEHPVGRVVNGKLKLSSGQLVDA